MSEDCLFCKIIDGEIPCSKVFENDKILAFLDINPVNKGHTLVIPKKHFETMIDMPEELAKDMVSVVQKMSASVKKATIADGFNIVMNNYRASGQEVPHAHFHIIPRFDEDDFPAWPHKKYKDKEMERYQEKIMEDE